MARICKYPDCVDLTEGNRARCGVHIGLCEVKDCAGYVSQPRPGNYQRYCSHHGYVVAQGLPFDAPPKEPKRAWRIDTDGYRVRKKAGSKGQVREYEHRYIMEQMIGRKLLPGENVHHKNGIRHDNDPSNLELWKTPQPPGQRVEDLVAWARQYLARAESDV